MIEIVIISISWSQLRVHKIITGSSVSIVKVLIWEHFFTNGNQSINADWLCEVITDSHFPCLFNGFLVVVGTYHDYANFRQIWVLSSKDLLMCLDLLGLCDAIHIGHLLVSQHKSVAHITASLCHVSVVHVHGNEPIRCLVTLFVKLALHDGSQGNQVKHDVVNE